MNNADETTLSERCALVGQKVAEQVAFVHEYQRHEISREPGYLARARFYFIIECGGVLKSVPVTVGEPYLTVAIESAIETVCAFLEMKFREFCVETI